MNMYLSREYQPLVLRSLKALPRAAVERFCRQFGIARIRDLPAAHAEDALAFVDVLAHELGASPPAPADPFA